MRASKCDVTITITLTLTDRPTEPGGWMVPESWFRSLPAPAPALQPPRAWHSKMKCSFLRALPRHNTYMSLISSTSFPTGVWLVCECVNVYVGVCVSMYVYVCMRLCLYGWETSRVYGERHRDSKKVLERAGLKLPP